MEKQIFTELTPTECVELSDNMLMTCTDLHAAPHCCVDEGLFFLEDRKEVDHMDTAVEEDLSADISSSEVQPSLEKSSEVLTLSNRVHSSASPQIDKAMTDDQAEDESFNNVLNSSAISNIEDEDSAHVYSTPDSYRLPDVNPENTTAIQLDSDVSLLIGVEPTPSFEEVGDMVCEDAKYLTPLLDGECKGPFASGNDSNRDKEIPNELQNTLKNDGHVFDTTTTESENTVEECINQRDEIKSIPFDDLVIDRAVKVNILIFVIKMLL